MDIQPLTVIKNDSEKDRVLLFVDALSDPILLLDLEGKVYAKNKAFEKCGSNNLNLLTLDQLSAELNSAFDIKTLCQRRADQIQTFPIKGKKGQEYLIHLHPFAFAQTHIAIVPSFNSEELLQQVLDCIPARVFWKDRQCNLLGGNHLFLSDCGVAESDKLIGMSDYDFFPLDEARAYVADDQQVMQSGQAKINIEEKQTRPNGEVYWLQTSKVPIIDNSQNVVGVMGSYTDITLQKNYQSLIEMQARNDQLTGLNNRQALQAHFEELEKSQEKSKGGLLFIDLDNFKTVNDTLGHAVGDELLKAVSKRLLQVIDGEHFLVRLGGDEFAVLLIAELDQMENQLVSQVDALAKNMRHAILQPFQIDTHHIQLGASIGITYFDSDNIDWINTFNEADMAMYDAKAFGNNSVHTFSEDIRTKYNNIHTMQSLLNRAIENNEFYINIQPQFNIAREIIGAEALLRWHNPVLGEVSPVDFIPVSEQSGTILNIGLWVFEKAFSLIHSWTQKYGVENIPPLAVNVSAKQFQSSDFLDTIKDLLKKYPVKPELVHFELTESLLVENRIDAIDKINVLKKWGFPLAIDDFGTGYSCLSYLNQLPIDKIKIDKSFTFKVAEDKRQAALVETIIAMAKKLDMEVIAEGVETEQQLDFLLAHDCLEFQGYYFSKPIHEKDYELLLNKLHSA